MWFAAIDWNRVLISGAIGAGIGVLIFLIRMMIGGRKGPDDPSAGG